MNPLEAIVEDLRSLPPAKLAAAADFVYRLKRIGEEGVKPFSPTPPAYFHRKKPAN